MVVTKPLWGKSVPSRSPPYGSGPRPGISCKPQEGQDHQGGQHLLRKHVTAWHRDMPENASKAPNSLCLWPRSIPTENPWPPKKGVFTTGLQKRLELWGSRVSACSCSMWIIAQLCGFLYKLSGWCLVFRQGFSLCKVFAFAVGEPGRVAITSPVLEIRECTHRAEWEIFSRSSGAEGVLSGNHFGLAAFPW